MARRTLESDRGTQERLQLLLTRMLREEDNKYCVDCDAKGPRWASWNLGVFVCIRCAGIHRNLGVHISKVKSVNLDSWTPQQVASMQLMGNSRGRLIYEAELPSDFSRPQSDGSMEQFIRDKYDRKKYIDKQFRPQTPPLHPQGWETLVEAEKQKRDMKRVALPSHIAPTVAKTNNSNVSNKENTMDNKKIIATASPKASNKSINSSGPSIQQDLLGLNLDSSSTNDVFGDLVSVAATNDSIPGNNIINNDDSVLNNNISTVNGVNKNSVESFSSDLLGLKESGLENQSSLSTGLESLSLKPQSSFNDLESLNQSNSNSEGKMSKDSIMALFAQTPSVNNKITSGPMQQSQEHIRTSGNNVAFMGLNPQSNPFLNASPAAPQQHQQPLHARQQKPVIGQGSDNLLGLFN